MNENPPHTFPQTLSVSKLEGVVQHYDWGGTSFIPRLIHRPNPENQPFAELWMGAHPKAPGVVRSGEHTFQLDELIAKAPEEILGAQTAATFGGRLPYLFKVLDVKKMLSIQVHPTKKEAEKGFEKENDLGIPLTARHRNYRDDNHKPEIMVALSDFWLLHGFKPVSQIQQLVSKTPEFAPLQEAIATGSLFMLYKHVMEMPQVEVNEVLAPLVHRLKPGFEEGIYSREHAEYWAVKTVFENPDKEIDFDRGIFSIFFFNLVQLKKGEGIFQDAGIPHAYLEGVNVELMANSDNVLRGGLTPKHIDVPELLKHTRFESVEPHILSGFPLSRTEKKYKSPVKDFELSVIQLRKGLIHEQSESHSFDILLLAEGEAQLHADSSSISLSQGEIGIVPAHIPYQISGITTSTLYKATVPLD